MLDRLISIVVAIFLALLVWLYARSRDQDSLRGPIAKDNSGRSAPYDPTLTEDNEPRMTYELVDLPVSFLCPPSFPYRPRLVDERYGRQSFRVTGPVQSELPNACAFIDLTGKSFADLQSNDAVKGRVLEETIQVRLPRRFKLDARDLRTLRFELIPTTTPAATPPSK